MGRIRRGQPQAPVWAHEAHKGGPCVHWAPHVVRVPGASFASNWDYRGVMLNLWLTVFLASFNLVCFVFGVRSSRSFYPQTLLHLCWLMEGGQREGSRWGRIWSWGRRRRHCRYRHRTLFASHFFPVRNGTRWPAEELGEDRPSMSDLVARTGRHQQRYEQGHRLVAGSPLYLPLPVRRLLVFFSPSNYISATALELLHRNFISGVIVLDFFYYFLLFFSFDKWMTDLRWRRDAWLLIARLIDVWSLSWDPIY